MRAERLISLVLLLQARGEMTAAELADELEVSERTVYRDVAALSGAGIPVYADHGRHGGYRLVDGYQTRLTGMSREEAVALFLTGLDGPAEDMGLAEDVAGARLKLLAALPRALRDAPGRLGQRFHLDVPGWFTESRPPERLVEVARAVWDDAEIEIHYGTAEKRWTVRPYGIVLKGGVWYLVGGNDRTFRVDRISAVRPTGATFTREESFDLAAVWAERSERFAESLLTDRVTLRLSPRGVRALRFAVEPVAARLALGTVGDPDEQGWVVISLPVESLEVAYDQLLRLGPEAEVVEPVSLRERLAEAAERMRSLYGPPQR